MGLRYAARLTIGFLRILTIVNTLSIYPLRETMPSRPGAPYRVRFVPVFALCMVVAGCGCEKICEFSSKCNRVYNRAVKTMNCPKGRGPDAVVVQHSFDDVDRVTVCCKRGERACVSYVCPQGRPAEACTRD